MSVELEAWREARAIPEVPADVPGILALAPYVDDVPGLALYLALRSIEEAE